MSSSNSIVERLRAIQGDSREIPVEHRWTARTAIEEIERLRAAAEKNEGQK